MQLTNYACGQWIAGTGKQAELTDAITGEPIATTSSGGLDFGAMLHQAREVGPHRHNVTFLDRDLHAISSGPSNLAACASHGTRRR